MSARDSYNKTRDKIAALLDEARVEAKKLFTEESKQLFEEHPKLIGFRYSQYTPYFNDGDECTFSANTEYPELSFIDSDGKETEYEEAPYNCDKASPAGIMDSAVTSFLQSFNEDDLKEMFGDHCQVTVTRNGTEVEQYDHD